MEAMIQIIQNLYTTLGCDHTVNSGDVYGLLSVSLTVLISLRVAFKKDVEIEKVEAPAVTKTPEKKSPEKEAPKAVEKKPEAPKVSWSERLKKGLSKSRKEVWGKLGSFMTGEALTEEQLEELEEILYTSDIGPTTAAELIDELQIKAKDGNFSTADLKQFLITFLKSKMESVQAGVDTDLYNFDESKRGQTKVIMVVGVNGAGKTTTIGKLATKLTSQGAKVVVGACDTFRAAAVDQLQVWCERAGAEMIRAKDGADPSGVAYTTVEKAFAEKADYCIIDTAGRLHTAGNLMDELGKTKRVISKVNDQAPHQTLLVIDSITGQNALRQAEEFNKALTVSGLVFTKCDGSSKAGNAIAIVGKLQVPITYIGVGESVEDLDIFDLDQYLNALLDI